MYENAKLTDILTFDLKIEFCPQNINIFFAFCFIGTLML